MYISTVYINKNICIVFNYHDRNVRIYCISTYTKINWILNCEKVASMKSKILNNKTNRLNNILSLDLSLYFK